MKRQNTTIPYSLLAKFFAGECSAFECQEVDTWRLATVENEALFQSLNRQWNLLHIDSATIVIPDKEKIWRNIQAAIHYGPAWASGYSKTVLLRAVGIAASIALFFGFSFSAWLLSVDRDNNHADFKSVVLAPSGQKTHLILPDSSQVWLNSGSQLTYNYDFDRKNRIVELQGEGYFDVCYDAELPFIVKTGPVDVQVHGTKFNVEAYADDSKIAISLLQGSVSLHSSEPRQLLTYIEPNQSVVISKANMSYEIADCDAAADSSWHLNMIRFEGASPDEVWRKMEKWYGVKITPHDVPPATRYWFSVKTESLHELLSTITRITPIEYQVNGEEVDIWYK